MAGHDGPFFGPDDMGDAGHVPADDIVITDGPVLCRPLFYPIIYFIAGGVFTGGIFFLVLVLGHPELVVEEAGLFPKNGSGRCKWSGLTAGHEHIPRMLTQSVFDVVVHDVPT